MPLSSDLSSNSPVDRKFHNVIACILSCDNCDITYRESIDVLRSRPNVSSVLVLPLLGNEVSPTFKILSDYAQAFKY